MPLSSLRRSKHAPPPIDGLVVAGLTELAMGALTGWPMALAVSRPDDLSKIGCRRRVKTDPPPPREI